jgi:hypothetical protein
VGHPDADLETIPAHSADYFKMRSFMKRKYLLFCVLCVGAVFGIGPCISDLLFEVAPLLL